MNKQNQDFKRIKVLVIHALTEKSRLTTIQYVKSFGLHAAGCEVTYVNAMGINIDTLLEEEFDLGIATYELLALRTVPFWPHLEKRITSLLSRCQSRVLLPQDDYTHTSRLDKLAVMANVNSIYTPLTKDLDQLYPRAISSGVSIHEALTGYIEDSSLKVMSTFTLPMSKRKIDVGQRVRHLSPQFGLEASRKGFLAENFANRAIEAGFHVDVSSRAEDTFVGVSWLHFLANCRFTISRKGGASIADPDGKLAERIYNKSAWHKDISDSSIQKLIKENEIRRGDFSAISPRLFEAAAMRVCQILEEDDYLGILKPWEHYIPIAADFSNIQEVFSAMKDENLVNTVVENAYDILIASGTYSYQTFVKGLISREVVNSITSRELQAIAIDLDSSICDNQKNSEQWQKWCKSYARSAFLSGHIDDALRCISEGKILMLDDQEIFNDEISLDHLLELQNWLKNISVKRPFLESYTWGWRSTTYFNT